jgi:SAM-dependent methyltransferase
MLEQYYDRRAPEYEQIYHRDDPIWQKELGEIAFALKRVMENKQLLEIACGTGYWTAIATETVQSVTAIDISEQMLAIARSKNLPNATFMLADAYSLESVKGCFDAGLANFWLSHVPKAQLSNFLRALHKKLKANSVIFMADNIYVPGLGGELIAKPNCKDTFKVRLLADGSKHEVLKNYYTKDELCRLLKPFGSELKINAGIYFWWLCYKASQY